MYEEGLTIYGPKIELLIDARRDAFAIVDGDPGLVEHRDLADEVRAFLGESVEWLFKS